jgi:hypothetical protein
MLLVELDVSSIVKVAFTIATYISKNSSSSKPAIKNFCRENGNTVDNMARQAHRAK